MKISRCKQCGFDTEPLIDEIKALKAKLEKLKDRLIWIRDYYGDKASIGGHHTFEEFKAELKEFVEDLIREGE